MSDVSPPSPAAADSVNELLSFLGRSPTPWHAVETVAEVLASHGFDAIDLSWEPRPLIAGTRGYVRSGGTIIAFQVGMEPVAAFGFRIASAHTDSPGLRLKPQPIIKNNGYVRLGVEVYGGVLLSTWMDRDLGLAGRVILRDKDAGQRTVLVNIARPVARIPNLAIHLNRGVNDEGVKLNAQTHLPAVFSLDVDAADPLRDLLASETGATAADVLSWDLVLYDLAAPTRGGLNGEFVFSGRLDNLASTHALVQGMIASLDSGFDGRPCAVTSVIALHDHEEVGSLSAQGAQGRLLETVLQHVVDQAEQAPGGLVRALANSWHLSADMAHAVHPGYADKHDGQHMPELNKGLVIKQNASQRYGTEGETSAFVLRLCEKAGVKPQWFANRSDLACGTTVGPIVGAALGVHTADIGCPMLSMHSIREMCGTKDHDGMIAMLDKFFRGEG